MTPICHYFANGWNQLWMNEIDWNQKMIPNRKLQIEIFEIFRPQIDASSTHCWATEFVSKQMSNSKFKILVIFTDSISSSGYIDLEKETGKNYF